MVTNIILVCLLIMLAFFVEIGHSYSSKIRSPPMPIKRFFGTRHQSDIWEKINELAELNTLSKMMNETALIEILQSPEPITCLAPNEEAFQNLQNDLLTNMQIDLAMTSRILTHHIYPGNLTVNELKKLDGTRMHPLYGDCMPISVNSNGNVEINGAKIIKSDILCGNGIIHILDNLIIRETLPDRPPSCPPNAASSTSLQKEAIDNSQYPVDEVSDESSPSTQGRHNNSDNDNDKSDNDNDNDSGVTKSIFTPSLPSPFLFQPQPGDDIAHQKLNEKVSVVSSEGVGSVFEQSLSLSLHRHHNDDGDNNDDSIHIPEVGERQHGVPEFNINSYAGVSPPLGYFDPLGLTKVLCDSEDEFLALRESELKHCRVAMLAFLGILIIECHHLLVNQPLQAPANSFTAFQYLSQMNTATVASSLVSAGVMEGLALYSEDQNFDISDDNKHILPPYYTPGDLHFDPLCLSPQDTEEFIDMQTREFNNGRLAMLAVTFILVQEMLTGQSVFGAIGEYLRQQQQQQF
eukprot:gene6629-13425_t